MILYILRGAFLVLVAAVTSLFVGQEFQSQAGLGSAAITSMIGIALAAAVLVIALDVVIRDKKLSSISGVFLGLIAGLVVAYALSFVVDLVGAYTQPSLETAEPTISETEFQSLKADEKIRFNRRVSEYYQQVARVEAFGTLFRGIKVVIGVITCYVAISLIIQTKNDFRFVIPYVEFAKEIRGNRPTLLDTSVIIDGRILDIIETRLMQGSLIVPKFVLEELQLIADSSDKLKRSRGRRGLDILQKLQGSRLVDVNIEERESEGSNVDQKLISLGQELKARVMTNDFNLNKIATLRGVDVINLNDLAKALRPVVLPGEHLHVKIVKPGESGTQGVGYLDDGTMVVVEGGRSHLNRPCDVVVTSTLQTSAGRMIFGRFANEEAPDDGPAPKASPGPGDPSDAKPSPGGTPPSAVKTNPRTPSSDASAGRRNPRRG